MKQPEISDWKAAIKAFEKKIKPFSDAHPFLNRMVKAKRMRMYYPISSEEVSEYIRSNTFTVADKNIISALEELNCYDFSLDENITKIKGDNNTRKIGRVLSQAGYTKIAEELTKRNNTNLTKSDYYIVLSINPYDIAHVSYKRNWSSCLDPRKNYYYNSMMEGVFRDGYIAMVAYLIKGNDLKIKRPLGRTFVNGYTMGSNISRNNRMGKSLYTLDISKYVSTDVAPLFDVSRNFYGNFHSYFKYKLSEIVKDINNQNPDINLKNAISATFKGYYRDYNTQYISNLRKFPKPSKSIAANSDNINFVKPLTATRRRNPTVDDVIFHGIVPPVRRNAYTLPTATKAHRILTEDITMTTLNYLRSVYFKYYHHRALLQKRPELLKNPRILAFYSHKGKEYQDLIEKYSPVS